MLRLGALRRCGTVRGQLRGTAGGSSQNRKHWGQTHKYSQTSMRRKQCRVACLMFTQTCKPCFCTWPSPGWPAAAGDGADSLGSRTVGPTGRGALGGSQVQSPGRHLEAGPSQGDGRGGPSAHTHPEPALALVGAVAHLHLAQGDGVDDPVDQLLADLLRGALQRQRGPWAGGQSPAGPCCGGPMQPLFPRLGLDQRPHSHELGVNQPAPFPIHQQPAPARVPPKTSIVTWPFHRQAHGG